MRGGVLIGHVVCPFLSKKFGRCDILYTLSVKSFFFFSFFSFVTTYMFSGCAGFLS